MSKELVDYWSEAHRASSIGCLTGTTMGGTLEFLRVPPPAAGSKVLCIGVGMGDWVRELHAAGAKVSSLDICTPALERVSSLGLVFLPGDKLPPDEFDLALSLWVAPHMSDPDLTDQLVSVVPALKPTGMFALHYNEPLGWAGGKDPLLHATLHRHLAAGRAMRLRWQIHMMVEKAGGVISSFAHEMPSPAWNTTLVAVHIKRAETKR